MVSKVCWQIHLLQCHGQFFSRYIHAFKERSLLVEVFESAMSEVRTANLLMSTSFSVCFAFIVLY